MKKWIVAFRLRTLPLAWASVAMGGFLAVQSGGFRTGIFLLCCLTTTFLQILSNLANDYGDSIHGADHAGRKGPVRAVQSGVISSGSMKNAVILFSVLSLVSGLWLLWSALHGDLFRMAVWLVIGLASITAAITYTAGNKPYGYMGLGDVSVLVFFGVIAVLGSAFMITGNWYWQGMAPALASGMLAVGVLNINNIRDIDSDREAGKFSFPVRFGRKAAVTYHQLLLWGAVSLCLVYVLALPRIAPINFLFLAAAPVFHRINRAVATLTPELLDPWLKKMALSALLFTLLFGAGIIFG
ncbi:MAG: 1,4-dihydroxy-2-naphthoate octaprenyltransferase [Bacteroidota bacterium]